MDGQLPEIIKTERSEVIRRISESNRMAFMKSMVGKTQRVLIEKIDRDGVAHGFGEHYLPVAFESDSRNTNRFQKVILHDLIDSDPPLLKGAVIGRDNR
jgi:threonylcarbamoyladenosine tRNA methylthiotransferase MtaB